MLGSFSNSTFDLKIFHIFQHSLRCALPQHSLCISLIPGSPQLFCYFRSEEYRLQNGPVCFLSFHSVGSAPAPLAFPSPLRVRKQSLDIQPTLLAFWLVHPGHKAKRALWKGALLTSPTWFHICVFPPSSTRFLTSCLRGAPTSPSTVNPFGCSGSHPTWFRESAHRSFLFLHHLRILPSHSTVFSPIQRRPSGKSLRNSYLFNQRTVCSAHSFWYLTFFYLPLREFLLLSSRLASPLWQA